MQDSTGEGPAPRPDQAGLQRIHALVASLHDRAGSAASAPVLQEAIAELETTLEELSVALQELHEQHEELVDARNELEAERGYFQELFDQAPDAYVLTDRHAVIRGANRAATRLLAVDLLSLVGRPLAAFVPPDERNRFRAGVHASIEAGRRVDWSFGIMPDNHPPILVSAHVTTGQDARGHVTDLRWQLRDVTDARRAQTLLRSRFAESREEAKNLRETGRWKDAFMAAAAHDLRTPLTVIDGAAHTMAAHPDLDERTRDRLVDVVAAQSARLRRLLDDLLDLDRFTRGTVTARREPTDVGERVAHAVDMLEVTSHPITVAPASVTAQLDSARVEQIVSNLVANAVHHTPAGTAIHVRVETTSDGVRLVVEDEGPGIDPELGDDIFQPFVTQERHEQATRGTGLGLSLVQLFAELHGGQARAENRQAGGARFVVDLPAELSP